MRVSEGRASLHAMPSGSILEQPKAGQLKIENCGCSKGDHFFCRGYKGYKGYKDDRRLPPATPATPATPAILATPVTPVITTAPDSADC